MERIQSELFPLSSPWTIQVPSPREQLHQSQTGISPRYGHHLKKKRKKDGYRKSANSAMSALALLAFLFFLHIIQASIKDNMINTPQQTTMEMIVLPYKRPKNRDNSNTIYMS